MLNGESWILDGRPLTVGVVDVALADARVRGAGDVQVTATLEIATDGPLEPLLVGVEGQLYPAHVRLGRRRAQGPDAAGSQPAARCSSTCGWWSRTARSGWSWREAWRCPRSPRGRLRAGA